MGVSRLTIRWKSAARDDTQVGKVTIAGRTLIASAICLLAFIAVACGRGGLFVPTATPQIQSYAINPASTVPPSLEEQIFKSDLVVRASLISATAGVETIPSGPLVAPTHRPVQELRFTVHEYLKGAGPGEALIVVRGEHTYLTESEARRAADAAVSRRNTTWDGRQGVLFLNTLDPVYRPPGDSGDAQRSIAPSFGLTVYHYDARNQWDYSVDTLSRAWLPASGTGSAQGSSARSSDASPQAFITDVSTSPPTVTSLADLRTQVNEFEAMRAATADTAGFERCIAGKIAHKRHRRAVPWTPFREEATLDSDTAAGFEVYRKLRNDRFPAYDRFWLTGPGANFFQSQLEDDDSDAANGYYHTISTFRPLPGGVYNFQNHWQLYSDIPCNFVPTDAYVDWTVTVTAPAGVLHEAFFDPVAIGSAVGADGVNGVLDASGFPAGGTATTITGLKWENGAVTMTLSPAGVPGGSPCGVHRARRFGWTYAAVRRRPSRRWHADLDGCGPALGGRRPADAADRGDPS